jgi:hypothetical protein
MVHLKIGESRTLSEYMETLGLEGEGNGREETQQSAGLLTLMQGAAEHVSGA